MGNSLKKVNNSSENSEIVINSWHFRWWMWITIGLTEMSHFSRKENLAYAMQDRYTLPTSTTTWKIVSHSMKNTHFTSLSLSLFLSEEKVNRRILFHWMRMNQKVQSSFVFICTSKCKREKQKIIISKTNWSVN